MNKTLYLKASLLIATLCMLPVAQAANLSKDDYKAGKDRISAELKADKAACSSMSGNAKDVCSEEGKAKQKVARAELEFGYTGMAKDQNKILVAKAESAYAVAKEKCDDQAGDSKSVCVKEAKMIETKALADAKLGKEIGAARTDAAKDKVDAEYDVAVAKCGSLAGDAKSACMTEAKMKFGKS
jgi:hypothetical protein